MKKGKLREITLREDNRVYREFIKSLEFLEKCFLIYRPGKHMENLLNRCPEKRKQWKKD